jgi:hypothetical protein
MREPTKIVAAIEIAAQVREAFEAGTKRHESAGWDDDVLLVELGRVLGAVVRWRDSRPSDVDQMVDTIRRVHAGLMSHRTPDADEAVSMLCPQTSPEAESGSKAGDGPTIQ